MNDLDQQLQGYYRGKHLSPEKVAEILGQTRQGAGKWWIAALRVPIAAAAAGVIIAVSWCLVSVLGGSPTERTVSEIVHNHLQQGALIVESDRYDVVQAALSQLPFPIQPNGKASLPSFALLGGKYCSIQGVKAAQLKLRQQRSGIIHTMYIWPLTQKFEPVQTGTYETDGVQVKMWTDQRLLYGLARSR